jgi:hypothetical protein
MATSVFRGDFFRVISDGEKMVILRGDGKDRTCYALQKPFLKSYNMGIRDYSQKQADAFGREYIMQRGYSYTLDLTLQGEGLSLIEHPLVMGVDIFDRLSITDYLDIINEKIKERP